MLSSYIHQGEYESCFDIIVETPILLIILLDENVNYDLSIN